MKENYYTNVPVGDIIISKRHRSVNEEKLEWLMESINEVGLLQPIVLTEDYLLVAGRHRLESCRKLAWTEVPALIKTYDQIDLELAEIDENLIRIELTRMERSLHLARRKQLYEAKYPMTTRGERRDSAISRAKDIYALPGEEKHAQNDSNGAYGGDDVMDALMLSGEMSGDGASAGAGIGPPDGPILEYDRTLPTFVKDTAALMGRSTTAVRDEANLGELIQEKLSEEAYELLAPTKVADSKSELLYLVNNLDEDMQLRVAKLIRETHDDENKKEIGVREALTRIYGEDSFERTVSDNGEASFLANITRAEKAIDSIMQNKDFEELFKLWTEEGQFLFRDKFLEIKARLNEGLDLMEEWMDVK